MTIESLIDSLAPLSAIRQRYEAISGPSFGSRAQRDARRRIGRYAVELAGMSLAVAIDHLDGWRSIVASGRLPTFAPFSLLRSATEGAVMARWLVDPTASADERIRRGMGAQIADYRERRNVEAIARRDRAAPTVDAMPGRTADQRIAEVEAKAKRARLSPIQPLSATELCRRYGRLPGEPDGSGEARYRILSGATHSKQWAAFGLGILELVDPPSQSVAGRARMTINYEFAAGATDQVIRVVDMALADLEAYIR